MNQLCYVPSPLPEESPRSLLMRAAYHNGYLNVYAMAKKLEVADYNRAFKLILAEGDMCVCLCEESPILGEQLRAAFYSQQSKHNSRTAEVSITGLTVPWEGVRHSPVFCPQCLREEHNRYIQDLDGMDACPYHNLRYISFCPSCGRRLPWFLMRGYYCGCNYDLRESSSHLGDGTNGRLLLDIFHRHDQDSLTRTYTALRCIRYWYFRSERSSSLFNTAIQIGLKKESHLLNHLDSTRKTFPNMPLKAITAPWLNSKDCWIQQCSHAYQLTLPAPTAPCPSDNCCTNFGLSFRELNRNLSIHKKILINAIQIGRLKPAHTDLYYYYTGDKMCSFIHTSANLKKRTPLPPDSRREDFYTIDQTKDFLHLATFMVKDIYNQGFFGDAIEGNNHALFLSRTTVHNFDKKYQTGNALARILRTKPRRISRMLKNLNIQPQNPHRHIQNIVDVYLRSDVPDQTFEILETQIKPRVIKNESLHVRLIAKRVNLKPSILELLLRHLNPPLFSQPDRQNATTQLLTQQVAIHIITWRGSHFTSREAAERLNMTYKSFKTRFFDDSSISTLDVGVERFYDSPNLKKMEKALKAYVTRRDALQLGKLSSSQFRRLMRRHSIHKLQPNDRGFSPNISLYRAADIIVCQNVLPHH
jgi:hypothetical protein